MISTKGEIASGTDSGFDIRALRQSRLGGPDGFEGVINEPTSLHKYLYASANPVMYNDATGMFADGGGSLDDYESDVPMFDLMQDAVRAMDWRGVDAFGLVDLYKKSMLSQFVAVEAAVRNRFSQVMGATQFAFAFNEFLRDNASLGDPL